MVVLLVQQPSLGDRMSGVLPFVHKYFSHHLSVAEEDAFRGTDRLSVDRSQLIVSIRYVLVESGREGMD